MQHVPVSSRIASGCCQQGATGSPPARSFIGTRPEYTVKGGEVSTGKTGRKSDLIVLVSLIHGVAQLNRFFHPLEVQPLILHILDDEVERFDQLG